MKLKFLRSLMLAVCLFMCAQLASAQTIHRIDNTVADSLERFIEDTTLWAAGDIIMLTSDDGEYTVNGTVDLYQEVTIMGDPELESYPVLRFYDNGFRPKEDSISITLSGFMAIGIEPEDATDRSNANHLLRFDQASFQNYKDILIEDVVVTDFKGVVQLYKNKNTLYESVIINNCYFENIVGDFIIDPRLNAVETLAITNNTMTNVYGVIKNPYNNNDGGNALGTVVQTILIDHNTIYNSLGNSGALVQLNDGRDQSIDFVFSNNIVSKILNDSSARPFLINEEAGSFIFANSVLNNIESTRDDGKWNFSSVDTLTNVTAVNIYNVDPEFADPDNGDFSIAEGSNLTTAGVEGDGIGDPVWLPEVQVIAGEHVHMIPNDPDSLENFMETKNDLTGLPKYWEAGDTILLVSGGEYEINSTLEILDEIVIMGDPSLSVKPTIRFNDNGFRARTSEINITLVGFDAEGLELADSSRANAFLRFDNFDPAREQSSFENIIIDGVNAHYFKQFIQLYKGQYGHYESLTVNNCIIDDIRGDNAIDPRKSSIKELTITNNTFSNIEHGFLGEMYWQNTEEENQQEYVDQNVLIDHNTFFHVVGGGTKSLIQNNAGTDGSVSLVFSNNIVSKIWWADWARPLRINEAAGSFEIKNSVFHDFYSNYQDGIHNIDSVAKLSNVTLTDVNTSADYPMFADTTAAPYDFTLPLSTDLISFGSDGKLIGDPRWFPVVGVTMAPLSEVVNEKDTVAMGVSVVFAEGVDLSVTWSVVNQYNGTEGEATIDAATGELIGVKAGDVLVVATSNFQSTYVDSMVVTVEPYIFVTAISLKGLTSLGTETNEITSSFNDLRVVATITPVDAQQKKLDWTISDESIATVTSSSKTEAIVSALASGTVTVTATSTDGSGISQTFEVVITGHNPVTEITVSAAGDASSILIGETLQLSAAVLPLNADDASVTWSVDKASVATIDANGLLTGVAEGEVVVKASANDDSFVSSTLTITVEKPLALTPGAIASVYPNPAANSIRINGISDKAELSVINLSGVTVLRREVSNNELLDITSLDAGVYFMRIKAGDLEETIRFSKQ